MYKSNVFVTLVLNLVGGQRHAPVALTAVKIRDPLYRRLGAPQGQSGRVQKISLPLNGIRSPDHPDRSKSLNNFVKKLIKFRKFYATHF
jgi:hypothetical protein